MIWGRKWETLGLALSKTFLVNISRTFKYLMIIFLNIIDFEGKLTILLCDYYISTIAIFINGDFHVQALMASDGG